MHRKLINSTLKNNKILKKNKPEETTTLKYKQSAFNLNNFAYFIGEDGAGTFNNLITAHGRKDKDKIPIAVIPPSKN